MYSFTTQYKIMCYFNKLLGNTWSIFNQKGKRIFYFNHFKSTRFKHRSSDYPFFIRGKTDFSSLANTFVQKGSSQYWLQYLTPLSSHSGFSRSVCLPINLLKTFQRKLALLGRSQISTSLTSGLCTMKQLTMTFSHSLPPQSRLIIKTLLIIKTQHLCQTFFILKYCCVQH